MFCVNCGKQLPDDAIFCLYCGHNVAGAEQAGATGKMSAEFQASKPMKALVCELCGGNRLIKENGYYACENCGTKYSLEEARKMMIEGTVQVAGTVQVDESNKIENYALMSQNAYKVRNYKEAEEYANRIIETDAHSTKGWILKGKAAIWQSTTELERVDEAIECWRNAINGCKDSDEFSNLTSDVKAEFWKFLDACLRQFRVIFESDDDFDADEIFGVLQIIEHSNFFQKDLGIIFERGENTTIYTSVEECVLSSWIKKFAKEPNIQNGSLLKIILGELFRYFVLMQTKMNGAPEIWAYREKILERILNAIKTARTKADEFYGRRANVMTSAKYVLWIEYMRGCSVAYETCGELASTKATVHHSFVPAMDIQKRILKSCSYTLANGKYVVDAKPSRDVVIEAQQRYKDYGKRNREYAERLER